MSASMSSTLFFLRFIERAIFAATVLLPSFSMTEVTMMTLQLFLRMRYSMRVRSFLNVSAKAKPVVGSVMSMLFFFLPSLSPKYLYFFSWYTAASIFVSSFVSTSSTDLTVSRRYARTATNSAAARAAPAAASLA